jgi:hypothetical protein
MVVTKKRKPRSGKHKEREKIRDSNVAVIVCNPHMLEISFYEIQSFLIIENIAKIILTIGSLFIGGVISAILSNIAISNSIIFISFFIFVTGLISDVYITSTKFNELKNKGA